MNPTILQRENIIYEGSGGVSAGNRSLGFRPAFRNLETGSVYPSRFADGRPAPIHVIDGLPGEVRDSVQSGFLLNGCFYDRDEAAEYLRRVSRQPCLNEA
jgi:hypothetical protein